MDGVQIVANKKVFNEHNVCTYCNKHCETVNLRHYHKKTCKMTQRTRRTPPTAADAAFNRKMNNLENNYLCYPLIMLVILLLLGLSTQYAYYYYL